MASDRRDDPSREQRRTPGRKPDPAREAAILDAAEDLLVRVGYDQLSFEAVALAAGASKSTIYRRWSAKRQLAAAILTRRVQSKATPADTGSLRGDLVASIRTFGSLEADREADLVGGLMRAMREDDRLRDLVHERVLGPQQVPAQIIVERAQSRGELSPLVDSRVLADVGSAMVYQRILVRGEDIDDAFAADLVDRVLLPLLHAPQNPRLRKI